ncbi:MAG: OsmC family protein [Candidatus Cloacimonetes bacterium]|jgi:putative redox protein|nr:OsmC family protein [Candidatus Cloacimonadota bacterium]
MKQRSTVKLLDKMSFDVELNGHHFKIDAGEQVGGEDRGPRPKGLMLSALGGCTGMDVVSILRKMKVTEYELSIDVSGDPTDVHPKVYHTITIEFKFLGSDLPISKIKKAVELSETRYCGVSEMLRKAAKLKTIIYINGEKI